MKITGIKHCALVFLIFIFATHSYAQVDQAKLNSLKTRYPWGSVYLTHISLLNLESILKDNSRRRTIAREYGDDLISRLLAWIQGEKAPKLSESVAFVEIDLNRIEAGFKKINDFGGEIRTIPWTHPEVVNIAHLFDRQLHAVNTFEKVNQQIHARATVQTVWDDLMKFQDDPYASSEMVYALARNFREQLNNQEVQLNELKTQNAALYEVLVQFKKALDGSLESQQKYFASQAIELQVNNAEFMERVALFNSSIKEARSLSSPQLASVQTDLSGTYTGTFVNCDTVGLSGETTLTINGNVLTTADGKSGRIIASKTSGYTAVALQMSGVGSPVVSFRGKKSGNKLTLSPIAGAAQQCTFTTSRSSGKSTGTEVANPTQSPSPSPTPKTSPASGGGPTPMQPRVAYVSHLIYYLLAFRFLFQSAAPLLT